MKNSRENILAALKSQDYQLLENEWLKVMEHSLVDWDFLKQVYRLLLNFRQTTRITELFELLFNQWIEKENYKELLTGIDLLASNKLVPTSAQEKVVDAYRSVYSSNPLIDKYLLYSGIETSTDFYEELNKLQLFVKYSPSMLFIHSAWGIGRVKDIDFVQQQIVLDFSGMIRKMTLSGAEEFLQPLPENHYIVLEKNCSGYLKKIADSNPIELVELILSFHGNSISVSSFKTIVTRYVFSEDKWSPWWNKVKILIKHHSMIDITDPIKGDIQILESPKKSTSSQFAERFIKSSNLSDKMQVILDYSEYQNAHQVRDDTPEQMACNLIDTYNNLADDNIDQKVKLYFVYEYLIKTVKGDVPDFPETLANIIKNNTDVYSLIFSFSNLDYQKKILEAWIQICPTEFINSVDDFLIKAPGRLVEFALKQVKGGKAKDLATQVLKRSLGLKYQNPELYFWGMQSALLGKVEVPGLTYYDFITNLLSWMEDLNNPSYFHGMDKKTRSSVLGKARKLVESDDFKIVKKAIIDIPIEDVRHLLDSFHTNLTLNESFKKSVEYAVMNSRTDLFEDKEKSGETVDSTAIHYCTAAMMAKKQSEYNHIVSVELPENSKDIAVARAHGDLRENAEYQAAKQKQKVLMKQADELRDLLSRARVLDYLNNSLDRVAFGTRMTVLNLKTNSEEYYDIFGIWEANPDNNIISYLSPLAKSFLTKIVGDIVVMNLPDGEVSYKVIRIERAPLPNE